MSIINITDFNDEALDVYARFTENQLLHINEPNNGIFIAESPKVVMRALDAGYKPISILIEDRHIEGEGSGVVARCKDIPIYTASFDVLTKLTGFKLTRGMLCAMMRKDLTDVQELCKDMKRIVVLENVMNPTNVGAIFRSAAALNMDAVILTGGCSNPLYRRSLRVSMGTVFQIPWTFIDGDNQGLGNKGNDILHNMGFKTVAMALTDDSVGIDDKRLVSEEKLAIVMGTEGEGLFESTISSCDYTVKIPMTHGVDSLNVAAASAVAFWELSGKYR